MDLRSHILAITWHPYRIDTWHYDLWGVTGTNRGSDILGDIDYANFRRGPSRGMD